MDLIKRHLSGLADFSGRENRQPFWLWILAVYIVQMVIGMFVSIPLTMRMMGAMQPMMGQDQTYLNEHPELASQMMMQLMVPFMRDLLIFVAILGLLYLVLIAAAVVRRLHDGDRSGWWAVPVAAMQIATPLAYWHVLPRFFEVVGSMRPETTPQQANAAMASILPSFAFIGLLGFVGFFLMIGLVVLLALRGTVGPNRYGDDLLPPPVVVTEAPSWQPAAEPMAAARIVSAPIGDRPPPD